MGRILVPADGGVGCLSGSGLGTSYLALGPFGDGTFLDQIELHLLAQADAVGTSWEFTAAIVRGAVVDAGAIRGGRALIDVSNQTKDGQPSILLVTVSPVDVRFILPIGVAVEGGPVWVGVSSLMSSAAGIGVVVACVRALRWAFDGVPSP